MTNGICPKCGSTDVRVGRNLPGPYGINAIPLAHGVVNTNVAVLDNYVCPECGYVESYIADGEKLDYIAQHWPKAQEGEATP
jgi:Zn finger protein HypA/HybF involved in hydrogenase expression